MVMVAACSYKPGVGGQPEDARGDGPQDASDGPPDSFVGPAPSACVGKWLAGTMTFGAIDFIEDPGGGSLTTSNDERDPFLSTDELQLYFIRVSAGQEDVLVASRDAIANSFNNPAVKSSLSDSVGNEGKLTMTGDDLTVFVGSSRANGSGGFDFWQGTRSDPGGGAFPALDQSFLAQVNTAGDQSDPHVSPDGLRLYYATGSPQAIMVAERTAVLADFSAPDPILEIASVNGDADPTLTADERVMLFTSNRPGLGLTDLWYATRAERDQPFSEPRNLAALNTTDDDGDPHISNDGCRVYWSSRRDTGTSDYDLFFVAQN